jgi:PadR family transcriptional regulator, regulatory protein PadR
MTEAHVYSYGYSKERVLFSYGMSTEGNSGLGKSDVLQGTLDLMVLQALDALGPLHGYGIARRIEQISDQVLQLNEGTVYTALLRLQKSDLIDAEWGVSENNRRAKFYSITRKGRKRLARETENWVRISGAIGRLLQLSGKGE